MLTQTEADSLIVMRKSLATPGTIVMPPGIDGTHDLIGADPRERFLLDIWRGALRLSKLKFQTRARAIVVLIRVDIGGAPHTNPDGQSIGGTHIHRYREGYEDRWAEVLEPTEFSDPSDIAQAFGDFCRICNIAPVPSFQRGLV